MGEYAVIVSQDGPFVLNVGTNASDTFDTSMIALYIQTAAASSAVSVSGVPGWYNDPVTNPPSGDVTINVGSGAGSSGSILNFGSAPGAAIYMGGRTGDITINNQIGRAHV